MTKRSSGFTVIELILIVAVLAIASAIFFVQKNNLQVSARDAERKTAINAMYYGLEQVYYKQHNSYPKTINQTILPSVDPALFIDPSGAAVGDSSSNYRYLPVNCTDNACASYTLRTTLENEADFVKTSIHN
jgi:type II secretory pathway pseudopilin PulG